MGFGQASGTKYGKQFAHWPILGGVPVENCGVETRAQLCVGRYEPWLFQLPRLLNNHHRVTIHNERGSSRTESPGKD